MDITFFILKLYTKHLQMNNFRLFSFRDPTGYNADYIWEASSYLKKYDDKYTLVLSLKQKNSFKTKVLSEVQDTKSVASFIDVNGIVIPELVENFVSKLHDSLNSQRRDK